jgi:hypothetical protein
VPHLVSIATLKVSGNDATDWLPITMSTAKSK